MRDLNEKHGDIRKFLLDQLSEDETNQIEELIFADPEFAEEVQIFESELATSYFEGKLTAEEHAVLEQKFAKSRLSKDVVEYERLFQEFISAKVEEGSATPEPDVPLPVATTLNADSPRESSGWWPPVLQNRAIWAYALLLGLVLSVVGAWYVMTTLRNRPDGSLEAQRKRIESELVTLNTHTPGQVSSVVTLKPAERDRSVMARVKLDSATPNSIIEFRIGLSASPDHEYDLIFLNDRHEQLFAIHKLSAPPTSEGSELKFYVLSRHLTPGDYQIDLNALTTAGTSDNINSYTFRVVPSTD
ncbi:MAG TPA: hypothetical protein VI306_08630 [Pyrinomonadaceae bacterium]